MASGPGRFQDLRGATGSCLNFLSSILHALNYLLRSLIIL